VNLHTASETISFAKKLENESARFYEELSRRYTGEQEVFLSFAKENGRNVTQIERAYYGVISDAIEGCFSFDVNPNEYTFEAELSEKIAYSDALDKAVEIEERIARFYTEAAEQSKSLMADVPRAFTMITKKRNSRGQTLRSLLAKGG